MSEIIARIVRRAGRILGLPGTPPAKPRSQAVTGELRRIFAGRTGVSCVQVGSNDGVQGDPLHELISENAGWRALFVEPVPSLFGRLRSSYGDNPRFSFANVAISASNGRLVFYSVSDEARKGLGDELPPWFDQLGSFDRGHILKHLEGRLEPYIVELQVDSLTLDALLERHGVREVDLLHSDTEGHDLVVLSSIDLEHFRPAAILYEHRHLSPEDREAARSLLGKLGYRLAEYGGDTLAERVSG